LRLASGGYKSTQPCPRAGAAIILKRLAKRKGEFGRAGAVTPAGNGSGEPFRVRPRARLIPGLETPAASLGTPGQALPGPDRWRPCLRKAPVDYGSLAGHSVLTRPMPPQARSFDLTPMRTAPNPRIRRSAPPAARA